MNRIFILSSVILGFFLSPTVVLADNSKASEFSPDPKSVQRYGPGYRYPQAGWIVLHIEGKPYDRGYQHGYLMAPEIAGYLRCFAAMQSPTAPGDGWKNTRKLVNALFLRRYKQEYLEEMKGIAEGATAAGARFDDRPIDLVDIAGLNAWPEIDTLESALEATPTGLEGIRFPQQQPRAMPDPKPMHCSAFAATGPATAGGKIVFGHITMFGLYPSLFYNVWLDIKPEQGHRVLMQSYPAGIQSGIDYYLNDAGLLVCETTIAQTRFDIEGMTEASRIRECLQYADSIDQAVEILKKGNNGLYTNEWLLADIKTNEIAMFELGTFKTKLYRSSKNEWFGGTEGFYWGCNNTKDLDVRLETIPGVKGRPANVVWRPTDRDKTWQQLFNDHKGKIDVAFGKLAFTTPPLAAYHSLDAKFTTTDLAKELKSWALFGPPLGRTWEPTPEERSRFPEVRPMVSNPWTILRADPPVKSEAGLIAAVDLKGFQSRIQQVAQEEQEKPLPTVPAWYGTLFPKTSADAWLAAGFSDYERIVALETSLWKRAHSGSFSQDDKDRLAVQLFHYQSEYLAGARAGEDVPLAKIQSDTTHDEWYRMAEGKGVLLLHQLRKLLGSDVFVKAMESFGRENAGKEVSSAQFQAHVEKASGKKLQSFFDYWLNKPGLPVVQIGNGREPKVSVSTNGKGYQVETTLHVEPAALPAQVEVGVETTRGFSTEKKVLQEAETKLVLKPADLPSRLQVALDGGIAQNNGGAFSVLSFLTEPKKTLIVYGTVDETPTNKEAARILQQAIRQSWCNVTVPIKSDKDTTDEDLKSHHLLLIGRPDSNTFVERFRSELPIDFSPRSFRVNQDNYAHPLSAVIAAGDNPSNHRYSVVVIAGLSAESTRSAASGLMSHKDAVGNVVLLAHGAKARTLVVPTRESMIPLAAVEPDSNKASSNNQR
jgi:hypothetical protein